MTPFNPNPLKKFSDIGSKFFNSQNYSEDQDTIIKIQKLYNKDTLEYADALEVLNIVVTELKKVEDKVSKLNIKNILILDNFKEEFDKLSNRADKLGRVFSTILGHLNNSTDKTDGEVKSLQPIVEYMTTWVDRSKNENSGKNNESQAQNVKKGKTADTSETNKDNTKEGTTIIFNFSDNIQLPKLAANEKKFNFQAIILTVLYESEFLPYKYLLNNFTLLSKEEKTELSIIERCYAATATTPDGLFSYLIIYSNRMGMTHNSLLLFSILNAINSRNSNVVSIVASSGICAGFEGKTNYGDVIVPSLVFDYSTGKVKSRKNAATDQIEDIFEPYWYPIEIGEDDELFMIDYTAKNQSRELNTAGIVDYINDLHLKGETIYKSTRKNYKCHFSPFASGAAVISHRGQAESISKLRGKLVGFDMEAYGLFFTVYKLQMASTCFVAKGVADYGTEDKERPDKDMLQIEAGFNSASVLIEIITNKLITSAASVS